jgi:uncharacterized linocin/CFP29 family protein
VRLSSWEQVGTAQNDVIAAVRALDEVGFHGPYAVALSPRPSRVDRPSAVG